MFLPARQADAWGVPEGKMANVGGASEEERDTSPRRVMTRNRGRLDYVKIISETDVCVNTREYIVHT